MDVRGHNRRAYIVNEFEIKPVLRSCIPPGEKRKSDAGGSLTGEYYVFSFRHKDSRKVEQATVGLQTARDFLLLAGLDALPRFDPFKETREKTNSEAVKEPAEEIKDDAVKDKRKILLSAEKRRDEWHPEALELYEAIMLLQIAWSINDPCHVLVKMSEEAVKYASFKPYLNRIEKLNNIIAKDFRHRKMRIIMRDLRKLYPDLKYYSFRLLENRLAAEDIESYF